MHDVWPRLDPGAVFCQTREDLGQYQAELEGGATQASTSISKCRMIKKMTAITILSRVSPAQTQVLLSDDSQAVGWTNAYLPAKWAPKVGSGT